MLVVETSLNRAAERHRLKLGSVETKINKHKL